MKRSVLILLAVLLGVSLYFLYPDKKQCTIVSDKELNCTEATKEKSLCNEADPIPDKIKQRGNDLCKISSRELERKGEVPGWNGFYPYYETKCVDGQYVHRCLFSERRYQ
jgi:hypothetical protein